VNSTYVDLRSIRAVHLNLKMWYGLHEQSENIVSCVSTITVGLSLNLNKQLPVTWPTGPKIFHQNRK